MAFKLDQMWCSEIGDTTALVTASLLIIAFVLQAALAICYLIDIINLARGRLD